MGEWASYCLYVFGCDNKRIANSRYCAMHSPDLSSKIDAADSQGITPPHRRNVAVNPLATPSSTTLSDIEALAEQVHKWYLAGSATVTNVNPKAQVPYADLTEEQKDIDRYVARQIQALITSENTKRAVKELEWSYELWVKYNFDSNAIDKHLDRITELKETL